MYDGRHCKGKGTARHGSYGHSRHKFGALNTVAIPASYSNDAARDDTSSECSGSDVCGSRFAAIAKLEMIQMCQMGIPPGTG